MLKITDYSEKAVIVTGDTWNARDLLKSVPGARGIWHRKAKGWIFSRSKRDALTAHLEHLLEQSAPVVAAEPAAAVPEPAEPEPAPAADPKPDRKAPRKARKQQSVRAKPAAPPAAPPPQETAAGTAFWVPEGPRAGGPLVAEIDAVDLREAAARLNLVAVKGHSRLGNVHICGDRYHADRITLSATCYDVTLRLSVPARVSYSGACLVDGAQLGKAIAKGKGPLSLKVTEAGDFCQIGPVRLGASDLKAWPDLVEPMCGETERFTISGPDLISALSFCSAFAQTNETRKNLMGVHVQAKAGRATYTATDGHRLGRTVTGCAGQTREAGHIIPRAVVPVLQRMVKKTGLPACTIVTDGRNARIEAAGYLLAWRMIDGTFPDVEPVIPVDPPRRAILDVESVAAHLEALSRLQSDKIKPCKLVVTAPDMLRITGQMEDSSGRYEDHVPAIKAGNAEPARAKMGPDRPDYVIAGAGFNARYLLDAFKAIGAAWIDWRMAGPLSPALLTDADRKDGPVVVVMPLRIKW